jgi:hypothetical protein
LTDPFLFSYQNQREVAEGIKRAYKDIPGLKREDLFIVSIRFTVVKSFSLRIANLINFCNRPPSCGTASTALKLLRPLWMAALLSWSWTTLMYVNITIFTKEVC